MKRIRKSIKYLTSSQVAAVIKAATSDRDKAMLAVVYQCGLRRSEVGHLRRSDWMPSRSMHGVLRVWRVKSDRAHGKDRFLHPDEKPLWARTARLLKVYLDSREDDQEALFLSRKKKPLGGQAVYHVFHNIAKTIGLPEDLCHPHALRHSIATHQVNMGADFGDIQDWLGHQDPGSTRVYAQVLTPRKEDLTQRSESSHCYAKF